MHACKMPQQNEMNHTNNWLMSSAHPYIHITPQLLDQHITLTHDCHVAESSHHRATHAPESSMDSNHGWWTEVCVRRDHIYIYCCALLPYIYYLSRYDAHHTDHINRADWCDCETLYVKQDIYVWHQSISACGWCPITYILSCIISIAATHHSMSTNSD